MVNLSIVIPTLNEQKYLPGLVSSIKKQKVKCEIIVADFNSKDRTRNIARETGCKVVKGGTPGVGRNSGAKAAKGDMLLFLDADIVLPDGFLKRFMSRAKPYKYASCRIDPLSDNPHHRFYFMLKNYANRIFPGHCSGQCLIMRKEDFWKVGGYDENVIFGEEHDLAKRLGKGKLFMDIFVYCHPRRLEKEGTYMTLIKDLYSEIYRFFRPGSDVIYEKDYGHFITFK